MKCFSFSTLFLQILQNLSGTVNGGFIYLPVSIASWWALILILVIRDLLNLGRSKLRYCFKSNDVQILL
jgi:hypothetical protein